MVQFNIEYLNKQGRKVLGQMRSAGCWGFLTNSPFSSIKNYTDVDKYKRLMSRTPGVKGIETVKDIEIHFQARYKRTPDVYGVNPYEFGDKITSIHYHLTGLNKEQLKDSFKLFQLCKEHSPGYMDGIEWYEGDKEEYLKIDCDKNCYLVYNQLKFCHVFRRTSNKRLLNLLKQDGIEELAFILAASTVSNVYETSRSIYKDMQFGSGSPGIIKFEDVTPESALEILLRGAWVIKDDDPKMYLSNRLKANKQHPLDYVRAIQPKASVEYTSMKRPKYELKEFIKEYKKLRGEKNAASNAA